MAAKKLFLNSEKAAMLVYQISPLKFELFSIVNALFCFKTFALVMGEYALYVIHWTWEV